MDPTDAVRFLRQQIAKYEGQLSAMEDSTYHDRLQVSHRIQLCQRLLAKARLRSPGLGQGADIYSNQARGA